MNTRILKRILLTLVLMAGFAYQSAKAATKALPLSIEQSSDFSAKAFAWRETHFVYGFFGRSESTEALFQDFEGMLGQVLDMRSYSLVRVDFRKDHMSFILEDVNNKEKLSLLINRSFQKVTSESEVRLGSHDGVTKIETRLIPSLHMTILEGTSYTNLRNGHFVTWTQINGQPRVELGQKFGPFSLSVLGTAVVGGKLEVGAKAQVSIQMKNGWMVQLSGELSNQIGAPLLSAGRFEMLDIAQTQARIRVSVTKVWGVSGLSSTLGASIQWLPFSRGSNEAKIAIFLELGKTFKNKKGQEVGSVYVFAEAERSRNETGGTIGIGGRIRF